MCGGLGFVFADCLGCCFEPGVGRFWVFSWCFVLRGVGVIYYFPMCWAFWVVCAGISGVWFAVGGCSDGWVVVISMCFGGGLGLVRIVWGGWLGAIWAFWVFPGYFRFAWGWYNILFSYVLRALCGLCWYFEGAIRGGWDLVGL